MSEEKVVKEEKLVIAVRSIKVTIVVPPIEVELGDLPSDLSAEDIAMIAFEQFEVDLDYDMLKISKVCVDGKEDENLLREINKEK